MPDAYEEFSHWLVHDYAEHCLDHGCPCAFPRFLHLVTFNHMDYSAGPLGCRETEFIIRELFREEKGCYQRTMTGADGNGVFRCNVCGSTFQECHEVYSATFERTYLKILEFGARRVGQRVVPPMPLVLGFYGFNRADFALMDNHFFMATLPEFDIYMKARPEGS